MSSLAPVREPPAGGAESTNQLPACAFGPFLLDLAASRLLRDGRPVDLPPRSWALLCYLVRRAGQLVTKDELLDAVWGHRFVGDAALKVAINALRTSLGEDAKEARWIHTVARRGYRFTDEVRPASPEPQSADRPSRAGTGDHAPDPADAAPPGSSGSAEAPAGAGRLPIQHGPLLGRDAELAQLQAALETRRLVTLTGPSGVGKTRLSLSGAAHAAPPDGVCLVRLDALSDAGSVAAAVARTLGLTDAAGRSAEALGRALSPLRLRLVLDNAEHLADGLAPQLAAWLRAAPGLQALVTSQRPLRIEGEQVLPLLPLAAPASGASAQDAASSPAVCLLVQRVRGSLPGWTPSEPGWIDAAAIARALDGLPLALELAAARVPVLGLAGVRDRLGARLQLLTRGASDAPQRHRTLRAALEWSVGLLGPQADQVLQRLSVMAGSFSLSAACAVAADVLDDDEWAALEALEQLRELALVVETESASAAQDGRFRLYDSVRLLATERLKTQGDEATAHAAHLSWLLGIFRASLELVATHPLQVAVALTEPEVDNLQAAMTRGLERLAQCPETELRRRLIELSFSAAFVSCRVGLKLTCARWVNELRATAASMGLPALSAAEEAYLDGATLILGSAGMVGPPADALASGERAFPVLDSLVSPAAQRCLLFQLGQLYMRLGRGAEGEAMADELRRRMPADASLIDRRRPHWLDALAARDRQDIPGYGKFWAEMLAQSQEHGHTHESWLAAQGLAQALYLQDRMEEAIQLLDRAVDEMRAAGRLRAQGSVAAQAVVLRLMRDASPSTLTRLREAVQILQSDGMVWWMADALAWVPLWQEREDDARRVQAWADALVAERGEKRGPVFARLRRAFDERLAPRAGGLTEPMLDEAGAVRLCFGTSS